jgi:hypothetical protein
MSKDKLRLILFPECNRSCKGCCNNDYDLNGFEIHDSFEGYNTVLITGGEPMLNPEMVIKVCDDIRKVNSSTRIILYTAKSKRALDLIAMLNWVDGITLTLHEQYDVKAFEELNALMKGKDWIDKTLRLNVFSNVDFSGVDTTGWTVKDGMEWIKDCPVPVGEEIKRYWG